LQVVDKSAPAKPCGAVQRAWGSVQRCLFSDAAAQARITLMSNMPDQPLLVEIIAYAPTAFYHCTHCEVIFHQAGVKRSIHQEQVESSLPPDLARDYQALSDWVGELFRLYCDRVVVKVIDAASLEGVIKTLRYAVRRYPAVIVGGQARFMGGDFQAAGREVARRLHADQVLQA
jgi:hypothetical protein